MNILIAYGGKSCEHDISIITACLAKGYFGGNIVSVYFDTNNRCFLVPNDFTPKKHKTEKLKNNVAFIFGERKIAVYSKKKIVKYVDIDVAVNCCHGLHGEDGTFAAICGMSNIPMVGSDIVSSTIAIDKSLTKTVLKSLNIPVVDGCVAEESSKDDLKEFVRKFGYPLIVKPNKLGSSIGVKIVHSDVELADALAAAFRYDGKVLCEIALTDFYELNCSAMKVNDAVETSRVDCPYTLNDILTFNDKYISNQPYERKKLNAPAEVVEEVQTLTKTIYEKLGFSGVIRVDYLYDKNENKLYVNEINSIPGSLAYGLWEDKYTRMEFGQALVEEAVKDFRELQQHTFVFGSGVLAGGGIKK